MLGILDYFWRLIPGNPILLRVVATNSKRRRDMFIRCGYLAFIIGVVIVSLLSSSGSFAGKSLDDLAKISAQLFRTASYWQLGMVAFLAPVFTAGAITQEKDSQTYDILLATPLNNGQIVLGSLLSRLFFVIALLVSGIPIFAITQIFGGVSIQSIVTAFAIAAATAFVTGAIAMAVAVFKVGTRRSIFIFYLVITIYLIGIYFLDSFPYFHPVIGTDPNSGGDVRSNTSWFTGIHPFLALRVIFNEQQHVAPELVNLPKDLSRWPLGWYFSNPTSFFISFMFFFSFVLVTPSIILLRRLAQSTNSVRSWILQKLHISTGDKTRKPRAVWANPIAWREAKTKVSAARSLIMRYGFMIAGLGGALVLVYFYNTRITPDKYVTFPSSYDSTNKTMQVMGKANDAPYRLSDNFRMMFRANRTTTGGSEDVEVLLASPMPGDFEVLSTGFEPIPGSRGQSIQLVSMILAHPLRKVSADDTRKWLLFLVIVEFAVILIIVTNASASTVTREKEDGSLDLLLSSPITSRYYIWGKLRGLVAFVVPLIAVPMISIGFFILRDFMQSLRAPTSERWIALPESILILPGTFIIISAFAAILGMNMSLRCRKTVVAVMGSMAIMIGASVALGFCGLSVLDNNSLGQAGLVFGAFSPFTLSTVLVDPWNFAKGTFNLVDDPSSIIAARWLLFIFGWIATGVYAIIVWAMYKSMVRNFDMTIRRQSR